MKVSYNKLVRDNIPEIIKNNPEVISVEYKLTAKKHELKQLVLDKLLEECEELRSSYYRNDEGKISTEELADVLEVLDTIKELFSINEVELNNEKRQKAEVKGKFEYGTFLEEVQYR